jgi:hypothetical protein
MQIWFKIDLTQSHLRTSFQIFSIVLPFLLIELRHRVSRTLYIGVALRAPYPLYVTIFKGNNILEPLYNKYKH